MNDITAITHRALQADVDEYIRAGTRPRSLAERRVEREICYADHLKAIVAISRPGMSSGTARMLIPDTRPPANFDRQLSPKCRAYVPW